MASIKPSQVLSLYSTSPDFSALDGVAVTVVLKGSSGENKIAVIEDVEDIRLPAGIKFIYWISRQKDLYLTSP